MRRNNTDFNLFFPYIEFFVCVFDVSFQIMIQKKTFSSFLSATLEPLKEPQANSKFFSSTKTEVVV